MSATIVYIPHGGGPRPLLNDPAHRLLSEFLQTFPQSIDRPAAILMVSAHWEERLPTLISGALPPLIYDYYGFPEESYRIEYPAPGHPQLAADVKELLHSSGIDAALDAQRGFDHGMFVPLKLMYPEADIPCVQLSLLASLDAAAHIALGEALGALRNRDLLIVGSGMSFHNIRSFYQPELVGKEENENFNQWLIDTCTQQHLSYEERRQQLLHWMDAPSALTSHPRPEHLLPLHVCFGLSGRISAPAEVIFNQPVMGRTVVGLQWRESV